jgi:dihydroneopterin aldolase
MTKTSIAPTLTAVPLSVAPRTRRIEAMRVFMRGLRVEAEIGVYGHEHGRRQPLVVDVEAELEPRPARTVHETVNYESFAAKARKLADGGHIDLVETFAERLAGDILDHPLVTRVTVRIEKPEALGEDAEVGVFLTMTKA